MLIMREAMHVYLYKLLIFFPLNFAVDLKLFKKLKV